jgi:hypothetical protein
MTGLIARRPEQKENTMTIKPLTTIDRSLVPASSRDFDDQLERNQDQIGEEVATYYRRNYSLMERIFGGDLPRIIREKKLARTRTHLDFQNALLEIGVATRVEAMREKYDAFLKSTKVHYRKEFAKFITGEREELASVIMERQRSFLQQSREKAALYEEFKDTPAAAAYLASIEEETTRFFEWLDGILSHFENIVKENFARTGISAIEQG